MTPSLPAWRVAWPPSWLLTSPSARRLPAAISGTRPDMTARRKIAGYRVGERSVRFVTRNFAMERAPENRAGARLRRRARVRGRTLLPAGVDVTRRPSGVLVHCACAEWEAILSDPRARFFARTARTDEPRREPESFGRTSGFAQSRRTVRPRASDTDERAVCALTSAAQVSCVQAPKLVSARGSGVTVGIAPHGFFSLVPVFPCAEPVTTTSQLNVPNS